MAAVQSSYPDRTILGRRESGASQGYGNGDEGQGEETATEQVLKNLLESRTRGNSVDQSAQPYQGGKGEKRLGSR